MRITWYGRWEGPCGRQARGAILSCVSGCFKTNKVEIRQQPKFDVRSHVFVRAVTAVPALSSWKDTALPRASICDWLKRISASRRIPGTTAVPRTRARQEPVCEHASKFLQATCLLGASPTLLETRHALLHIAIQAKFVANRAELSASRLASSQQHHHRCLCFTSYRNQGGRAAVL